MFYLRAAGPMHVFAFQAAVLFNPELWLITGAVLIPPATSCSGNRKLLLAPALLLDDSLLSGSHALVPKAQAFLGAVAFPMICFIGKTLL